MSERGVWTYDRGRSVYVADAHGHRGKVIGYGNAFHWEVWRNSRGRLTSVARGTASRCAAAKGAALMVMWRLGHAR
jgi:hypothetical protein